MSWLVSGPTGRDPVVGNRERSLAGLRDRRVEHLDGLGHHRLVVHQLELGGLEVHVLREDEGTVEVQGEVPVRQALHELAERNGALVVLAVVPDLEAGVDRPQAVIHGGDHGVHVVPGSRNHAPVAVPGRVGERLARLLRNVAHPVVAPRGRGLVARHGQRPRRIGAGEAVEPVAEAAADQRLDVAGVRQRPLLVGLVRVLDIQPFIEEVASAHGEHQAEERQGSEERPHLFSPFSLSRLPDGS